MSSPVTEKAARGGEKSGGAAREAPKKEGRVFGEGCDPERLKVPHGSRFGDDGGLVEFPHCKGSGVTALGMRRIEHVEDERVEDRHGRRAVGARAVGAGRQFRTIVNRVERRDREEKGEYDRGGRRARVCEDRAPAGAKVRARQDEAHREQEKREKKEHHTVGREKYDHGGTFSGS